MLNIKQVNIKKLLLSVAKDAVSAPLTPSFETFGTNTVVGYSLVLFSFY